MNEPENEPPFQFTLRGLLIFTAVVSVLLALVIAPLVRMAQRMAWQNQCQNNIKQILVALYDYHDVCKCFPPAYVPDANGKPMHSWRVLILPYLDQRALYDRYDFTEPWNGPNNRKLAAEMPDVFRCPAAGVSGSTATNYLGVSDEHAAFAGEKPLTLTDFMNYDGTAYTIMLVEVGDSSVCWMDPQDLSRAEAFAVLSGDAQGEAPPHHSGGVAFGYANGDVYLFPRDLGAAEWLEGALTRDLLDNAGPPRNPMLEDL